MPQFGSFATLGRLAILLLGGLFLFPGLSSANPTGQLPAELARLRAEVDALATTIETEKAETRNRLQILANQKSELEAETRRQDLKLANLSRQASRQEAESGKNAALAAAIAPALEKFGSPLRSHVDTGIPFKSLERKKNVEQIESQWREGTLTPGGALARLWSHVEDELRLGGETGLYRQPIPMGGETVMAEVIKVGMVMLLFVSPDGTVGRAVDKGNSTWTFVPWDASLATEREQVEQTRILKNSLQKQVRTGLFALPGAWVFHSSSEVSQ